MNLKSARLILAVAICFIFYIVEAVAKGNLWTRSRKKFCEMNDEKFILFRQTRWENSRWRTRWGRRISLPSVAEIEQQSLLRRIDTEQAMDINGSTLFSRVR